MTDKSNKEAYKQAMIDVCNHCAVMKELIIQVDGPKKAHEDRGYHQLSAIGEWAYKNRNGFKIRHSL